MLKLLSEFPDGEPSGHGDQEGDEGQSLTEDSGFCEGEWKCQHQSGFSHCMFSPVFRDLQKVQSQVLCCGLSRPVQPTASSPSRPSAASSVVSTSTCSLVRWHWPISVSLKVKTKICFYISLKLTSEGLLFKRYFFRKFFRISLTFYSSLYLHPTFVPLI